MSLAENLLNSLDENNYKGSRIGGNHESEPHIIVDKTRTITVPNELKVIAVKGDKDIETVTIDCVRYWDGHDLSNFAIYLNYILPNGDEAIYIPKEIVRSNDTFSFNWVIGREFTQNQGSITFWIVAKLADSQGNLEKQWSSFQNSECTIAQGGDIDYIPDEKPLIPIYSVIPRLYAPTAYIEDSSVIYISNDSRNGYQDLDGEYLRFTRGYNIYVDGALKRSYQIGLDGAADARVKLTDIVDPVTEGKVTVTAVGEGFGITFRESEPSNEVLFNNSMNFIIDDVSYISGINMTWGEWINSDLAPDGFEVNGNGDVIFNGLEIRPWGNLTYVTSSDIITENRKYTTIPVSAISCFDLLTGYTNMITDQFYFENGMTWKEWKNSDFNNFKYVDNDEESGRFSYTSSWNNVDVWCDFGGNNTYGILYMNNLAVSDNDTIRAGAGNYQLLAVDDYKEPVIVDSFMIGVGETISVSLMSISGYSNENTSVQGYSVEGIVRATTGSADEIDITGLSHGTTIVYAAQDELITEIYITVVEKGVKSVTLASSESSKTLFEGEGYGLVMLNGIDGLTDNVSSVEENDGTITINYETDTDLNVDVYYTGI